MLSLLMVLVIIELFRGLRHRQNFKGNSLLEAQLVFWPEIRCFGLQ
jgi:hypothetical protein